MSKAIGIYVNFTKITHRVWSCHVTLASNFKNYYFLPNSVLNFSKSYQIWRKWAQEQKCYKQKQIGVENTPSPPPPPNAYRVNEDITFGDIVYFEPKNIQYKNLVNGVIDHLKVSLIDGDGNEIVSNFKISIVLHMI